MPRAHPQTALRGCCLSRLRHTPIVNVKPAHLQPSARAQLLKASKLQACIRLTCLGAQSLAARGRRAMQMDRSGRAQCIKLTTHGLACDNAGCRTRAGGTYEDDGGRALPRHCEQRSHLHAHTSSEVGVRGRCAEGGCRAAKLCHGRQGATSIVKQCKHGLQEWPFAAHVAQ